MPIGRRRLAGGLVLATVAVAGLLSMHGFDGALASLAEPAHSNAPADDGSGGHMALGVCVFVVAVTALGIAAIGLAPPGRATLGFALGDSTIRRRNTKAVGGRFRLNFLCVLRL